MRMTCNKLPFGFLLVASYWESILEDVRVAFCEEVFHGPLSVQERWITHLQKHILSLGYKGKTSPPAAAVAAPALVHPVAV